jgi:hypothetical protein
MNMKSKLLIIPIISLFVLSCEKDLTDLNQDTKRPSEVPAPTLFSNAQKNLSDVMASSNVNLNIFRLISQFWTQTTYVDESNYDLETRNIPQNFWNVLYRDVLRDLSEAKKSTLAEEGSGLDTAQQSNQLAMINIMEVYAWSTLVNAFGDVPYSEALNFENVQPRYDDAREIYDDLLARLDTAVENLDPDAGSFGSADLIYGGDVEKWIRFGNSLRLRLGMMLADVDAATAKAVVEEAAGNVFQSNSDNAIFQYLESPPNTNPIWVDLVQSGRKDYVAANTIVDVMNDLEDPRRPYYFTLSESEDYKGGIYGASNEYVVYSKPAEAITEPDFEAILMDYAEVEFLLAEAAERGFTVEGSAEEHYNNAVTASITYWGGSEEDAQVYLSNPEVNYATAEGDWREKIGTQKWLALYNRGFDAWTEWRRLGYPDLLPPADLPDDAIPVRFTYPVQEQNLNKANYEAAASAIGGDVTTTRLFWDVL